VRLQAAKQGTPPVCVVHGPFGSGKSTLLVAMLEYFALQLSKEQRQGSTSARILVAAHTNVAVDRLLIGLIDHGFTGVPPHKEPLSHRSPHPPNVGNEYILKLESCLADPMHSGFQFDGNPQDPTSTSANTLVGALTPKWRDFKACSPGPKDPPPPPTALLAVLKSYLRQSHD